MNMKKTKVILAKKYISKNFLQNFMHEKFPDIMFANKMTFSYPMKCFEKSVAIINLQKLELQRILNVKIRLDDNLKTDFEVFRV